MEVPVKDRSNYLKGLLIVARKDNQIAEAEKKIIKKLAFRLGFASDFYEETIRTLLSNKYIDDKPIIFSEKVIAESFLSDGLGLAFSDAPAKQNEIAWLKETALINGISEEWFEKHISAYIKSESPSAEFALYSII